MQSGKKYDDDDQELRHINVDVTSGQDCCTRCGEAESETRWISYKHSNGDRCKCFSGTYAPSTSNSGSYTIGMCTYDLVKRKKRQINETFNIEHEFLNEHSIKKENGVLKSRVTRAVSNTNKQREVVCEPMFSGDINYWKLEYEVPTYCWSMYSVSQKKLPFTILFTSSKG